MSPLTAGRDKLQAPGRAVKTVEEIVFLFDVDNTLLNNDLVIRDLESYLENGFGIQSRKRYFKIIEELRAKVGYVDYLGALQRYRLEKACDPRLLSMSSFLVDYPFADRLYPGALDVLRHVRAWGPTVILSDGDVVFQPRKVQMSGLWDAVEGRVLIYIHKERMLSHVRRLYPARHYVMVDDKLRILAAMKRQWGPSLTTVFPRQGHYAENPADTDPYPPADLTVAHIDELLGYDLAAFLAEQEGICAGAPKRSRRPDEETGAASAQGKEEDEE